MIPMTAVLLLVTLLAVGLVTIPLRRWMRDEAKTEARLHAPGAHTAAFVVPNGLEPALLMAALSRAGFAVVADNVRGEEVLLIECEPSDRSTVRRIITTVQEAHAAGHAGARVEQVRFQGETPMASS
jgi:hypothetical protein